MHDGPKHNAARAEYDRSAALVSHRGRSDVCLPVEY
jgi:hypothetical protein